MKRSALVLAIVSTLFVSSQSPSLADSSSEKNKANSVAIETKWLSPISPVSVKAGSELTLKLSYMYTGSNTFTVKGDAGKKSLTIQNLNPMAFPLIFPGQTVEVVTNSDMTSVVLGTRVQKVKENTITLNNPLKSAVNGTIKVSGNGAVDKSAHMQIFVAPCTTSATPPQLIFSYQPNQKSETESNSSSSGYSSMSFKWKISKNQPLGCYNAYARFVPVPGTALSLVPVPSDLKNMATITVASKAKSKD